MTYIQIQESAVKKWAARLSEFLGIPQEEAESIAYEKLESYDHKMVTLEQKQREHYSVGRQCLIDHLMQYDPLAYIESERHAKAIMGAHRRHKMSNYDELLRAGYEAEKEGLIPKGSAKTYARCTYRFYPEGGEIAWTT